MNKILLSLVILCGLVSYSYANFTGKWLVESKQSIIKIEKCENSICGTIVWLKQPLDENGNEKIDKENQDKILKNRKIIGMKMIWGFEKQKQKWVDGKIYNPENGKTYKSKIELNKDGTLALEGCVWIICKTQTWTRVE